MKSEGFLRRWTKWSPAWTALFSFTTKKHAPILTLAMASALIASFTTPIFSVLLGEMFDLFTLYGGGKIRGSDLMDKMTTYTLGVAGLGAAGWLFNASYFILFVTFSELQVANARNSVFEALFKKSQEWFETQPDGTRVFLSSLQDQLHELQMATSQPLGLVVQYSFRTIVSLGLAFYTSWSLSPITLAGIPVFSAIISFLSSKMKTSIEGQQKELASMSRTVNIATGSIDTVKCLNGQAFELRNFTHGMEMAAQHYLRQARLNSFQIATIRLMMFSMFVLGFWYGSTLATSGKLSAGEVVRTFWACLTAAQSIEMVLPQVLVLEKGKVAASAMKTVIDDPAEKRQDTKELLYPQFCEGDIEVRNLSFAYPNTDILSLNSVNFFFPAGETTFVIGKSGSGKSTLGQLLAHFYLPTTGEIRIDGVPMQTLSVDWIRNNVTIVEQRSVLFSESIFMNIAFGRRDYDQISKGDVQECIDLAMLQSTINNLPSGIDTCVGTGGSFLSGGQRQRVAIARARLRDTPILILDEPTSALDGANRVEVMKAIRRWRKEKTTIMITHDMSQIQDQDFVYIMEQGTVAQAGYGNELKSDPRSAPLFASVDRENRSEVTNATDKETYGASGSCDDVYLSDSSVDSMGNEDWRYSGMSKAIAGGTYLWGSRPNTRDHRRSSYRSWRSPVRADSHLLRISLSSPMYELDTLGNDGTRPKSTASHLPARVQPTPPKRRKRRFPYSRKTNAPKPQDTASLRRIMKTIIPSLTKKQRVALLFGCISTLVHSSATPVFSYCLSQLQVSFYKPGQSATKWALAVLGVAICDGTVSYFMHYLLELCGQAWVDSLRKSAFRRIIDQPRQWFEDERNSPSQLSTSLGQDGEELRNLVGRFGGFVLVAVSIAIMSVIWSMVVCWNLTLVALACGPVIYAITRGFESTSGLWERRSNDASRGVSEIFVETFAEIRTVRTLTLEPFFHKKYIKAAAKCLSVGLRRAGYVGILFGLVECTVILVSALIFYYGAVLVSSSRFAVEDIMTVFSMLLFSIGYASSVLGWIPQISTSRDMGARLLRLASLPEGASHEHLGVLGVAKTAPVKILRLNFRYPSRPEAPVLRGVSITIPRGSCTAIVGRSGSGKSTIASLLLALYESPEATDGGPPALSLDGIDIRRLHTPTLRSLISVVSQQSTIFPGTITSNICYGLDESSTLREPHNVRAAATAAGIDEFIMSLPDGYSTVIGDGAVGISGGQAQRVVIARALIRRPQILILDEATSALDPASAEVIRRTVRGLVSARLGLTVIIITHAKEMMDIADNVVVLEQGCVVERGPYEVLSKRAGGKLRALIEDGGEDMFDD